MLFESGRHPKKTLFQNLYFLILSVVRMRKWNVRMVTNPLERKIVKIVNRNRYVNLAPNVNTVKFHGAVKPRIVQTLSWLIPPVPIALISP